MGIHLMPYRKVFAYAAADIGAGTLTTIIAVFRQDEAVSIRLTAKHQVDRSDRQYPD
jgi:hypothetical protein